MSSVPGNLATPRGILVVDLGRAETYRQLHVPGAVFLDYGRIVAMNKPVMGLLPDDMTAAERNAWGIDDGTGIVLMEVYEGGPAAAADLRSSSAIRSRD